MRFPLKRSAEKVALNEAAPVVAFSISDVGVASISAADVLKSERAQKQIAAVKQLRLAASQLTARKK